MKKIGRTSFTAEGYENFVSLTKEEQVKKIGDGLSPKDYDQAEKLLTRVPNGKSIGSGNEQAANDGSTADRARSSKNNSKKPRADKGENAGV